MSNFEDRKEQFAKVFKVNDNPKTLADAETFKDFITLAAGRFFVFWLPWFIGATTLVLWLRAAFLG